MSNKEILTLLSGSESTLMPTGYGVVMANLLPRLAKRGWKCYHVGWQHNGMPQEYGDGKGGIYLQLNHGLTSMLDPAFPEKFPHYLKTFKPDCAFSLIDYWFTEGLIDYCNEAGVPYVNYFPVDGDPFYTPWLDMIKKTHTPLAMSKYGRDVVTKAVMDFGRGGWTRHFGMPHLYHGVDLDTFKPLARNLREENRQNFFKKNPDTFCVGVIGKNCMRKQHTKVIDAFAKFAKDKKDAVMLMKVGDPANRTMQGNNLYEYIKQKKIEQGKVLFIDQTDKLDDGILVSQLAAFYNLFDVYASSTSGEGFGIPTVEAMACGTPAVITDYTSSAELVGDDRGFLIPPNDYVMGEYNIRRAIVDVDEMAKAFQYAYDNRSETRKMGEAAFRFAKKNFGWDDIANEANFILRKAANERMEVKK
ncbi:glycosyltransferase family 4 protein [Sulfuricurvum sp.]|uniref:glycosyltransferase family 4 protein n=1 Tax=Sulfuricurvum sp. TaxID=2025608 RepID=UPI00356A8177